MLVQKTTLCCVLLILANISSAQIFGRIMDRASEKLSDHLEDKVVEKISEEIARAAYRPVDKAIDDMFRSQYEQDSTGGAAANVDYGDFLSKIMKPVDLPTSYTFDVQIYATTKDYDGDKNDLTILMSSTNNYLGMITYEDGKETMMVIDPTDDIMAMYDVADKKVTAFPSMLKMATKVAADQEMNIERTGKTKKIAGYECAEYLIEDETATTQAYVSENFPASWAKAFGEMFQKVSPTSRNKLLEGMTLQSESKTKKKNKKSTFDTKKVTRDEYIIQNADYEKIDYLDHD